MWNSSFKLETLRLYLPRRSSSAVEAVVEVAVAVVVVSFIGSCEWEWLWRVGSLEERK